MRILPAGGVAAGALLAGVAAFAQPASAASAAAPPRLLQQPALSAELIAFSYGGDIWTTPRAGGRAVRLTTGVGVESGPVFSPDGRTLAFSGEYDGNLDVYTVPVAGGVPHRVTYHPGRDVAVGWSRDGRSILFRSARDAHSRYTQLYTVAAEGGAPKVMPLPMAFAGQMSPDGAAIAYTPLAPAFSFDYTSYTAWGNYRGGRAGTVWITTLPGLDSVQVPHEAAADFSPVWAGGKLYFLSGRRGRIGVWSYDPATTAVAEVLHNDAGADIRSLATDGRTLIFDRLGELYTLEPGGRAQRVGVDVAGDMPDVRPRILNVADEVEHASVSPTGLRVAVEAHGEILTAPLKHEGIRNLTNTPGAMERAPAWSPDGQSVAYFSDESGLYALHVASQKGAGEGGAQAVRKFELAAEPAYYFDPVWSPDSRRIAFHDNRLHSYVLEVATGRLSPVGEPDVYGGFASGGDKVAWSPDSRWLAYTRGLANHMHAVFLWSAATGAATQLTDAMADASSPAFDRNGKHLYFLASNNAGATLHGLDMTSDLYRPTSSIYALALSRTTPSPTAPEVDDEKTPSEAKEKAREASDATPAGQAGEAKREAREHPRRTAEPAAPAAAATSIDLAGLSPAQVAGRITALPIPARDYRDLQTGKPGVLFFIANEETQDPDGDGPPDGVLTRWTVEDRKAERLAEHVQQFQVTADGAKLLVALSPSRASAPRAPGSPPPKPGWVIASADKPLKPGDPETALKLDKLEVRVDPAQEWAQMYREVWRIQRAYFYDPAFHGVDTVAEERRLRPYADAVLARSDLNYVFQEMLTAFSVGHLRGSGGAIPEAKRVPGGLLGADYAIRDGRYCLAKIYTGGGWSPEVKAPLAQPGMNVSQGDCVLAVDSTPVTAAMDIQQPLEGAAGHVVTLRLQPAGGGAPRDVAVTPVASETALRNLDWIDSNRRRVSEMSGGKLAYVYMPDTGGGGFAAFNRYFFAQTDKAGVILDERFNAGGQVADYVIEVLGRKLDSYWQPRYGAVEHSPAAAVYGPKVMIANEVSGSGGDAMPWLFKHDRLGPVVGKRTWGGLVGIGAIPVLMDGGAVTSPSVGFFSPAGEWDVENHGVEPDYVVEQDPRAVAAGRDPQLEQAVALAMADLAKHPRADPQRPAFPVYRDASLPAAVSPAPAKGS